MFLTDWHQDYVELLEALGHLLVFFVRAERAAFDWLDGLQSSSSSAARVKVDPFDSLGRLGIKIELALGARADDVETILLEMASVNEQRNRVVHDITGLQSDPHVGPAALIRGRLGESLTSALTAAEVWALPTRLAP